MTKVKSIKYFVIRDREELNQILSYFDKTSDIEIDELLFGKIFSTCNKLIKEFDFPEDIDKDGLSFKVSKELSEDTISSLVRMKKK